MGICENAFHAKPISDGKGTYPSIVADILHTMPHSSNSLAISEVAKLVLKKAKLEVTIPASTPSNQHEIQFGEWFTNKLLNAQDAIPTLIVNIQIIEGNRHQIEFSANGTELAMIGPIEPESLSMIWINEDLRIFTREFLGVLFQYYEAGFPGCEDCLGPAARIVWDEAKHRHSINL